MQGTANWFKPLEAEIWDGFDDLITEPLKELGRLRWKELETNLQNHVSLSQALKRPLGAGGTVGTPKSPSAIPDSTHGITST